MYTEISVTINMLTKTRKFFVNAPWLAAHIIIYTILSLLVVTVLQKNFVSEHITKYIKLLYGIPDCNNMFDAI